MAHKDDADLYQILGVTRDADAGTLKRAYLKLARECHPDKNAGDEGATEKFQRVGRAYATLSDEEKRKIYDATGIVDDVASGDSEYWRRAFEKVTFDKLDEMKQIYQGSEEEEADLRSAYLEAKGDMGKILARMPHCSVEDEPRFHSKLEAFIRSGALPEQRAFSTSTTDAKKRARKRNASAEAAEAEALAAELGVGAKVPQDLQGMLAIRQRERQSGLDAMIASLEEKHRAKPSSKHAKGRASARADPLDDKAFAALQKKMQKGR
ncbi:hypothetical protein AB1Y20_005294 [Prymnesium parvum]|uniref:J domain-containing protein n=1 Tax=Prymnesium parvum TaxID=97485 RepID=A0AB34J3Q8_PRYPA